jgi:hypothetical protein
MFRRRPMRRGPGIVGTVARTAVVAGTATVAVKGVSGAMDSHAQAQQQAQQQQASQQEQVQPPQTQPPQEAQNAQPQQMPQQMPQQPAADQAPASTDLATQLQQLAQLKASGALTDEEFQAAKAKILG